VLRDVVKIIRDIQPDVILTRFSPDPAPTHGHHTASAILAREAFRVAATDSFDVDMQAFNQTPWQAKRVYWNISSFFFQGREKEFNANNYLKIDIGTYNPIRGKGYQEIASDSRSQHKSQGFGTATSRGSSIEYFQFLGGDSAKTDVLEGINWSVKRLPRGEALDLLLQKAKAEYNPNNPSAITNILIDAYQVLLGEMKNMSSS
ncbi:MAG: LmbE family protein, partial [Flexibacteraceae bacterium]